MSPAPARLHIGLAAVLTLSAVAASASAATSATLTYAGTANADSTYTYQLLLKNTGTTPLKTLWFSWIPYESFLPSQPTAVTSPASWSGQVVNDFYGNSILWDTAGAGLAPGASTLGFGFTSPDSPATLAGLDHYFGYYPIGMSYVYSGTVATPTDPLPTSFGVVTAAAGLVPEPTTLLVSAAVAMTVRRRRA